MLSCTRCAMVPLSELFVCSVFGPNLPTERFRLNRIPPLHPVDKGPHNPEDGMVEDRQEHPGRLLLPRRLVDAGERQPSGPPGTPGEEPQRRTHGGLLRDAAASAAQEAEYRARPDAVGEVRGH